MRRFLGALAFAAVVLIPASALATVLLMTASGMDYDIYETTYGYILDGETNAYDGGYYLDVNGISYRRLTGTHTLSMGGRQVDMPEESVGGLMVRRFIYVPASGGEYVRYLDVVRNPGATDAMATITIRGNLGSNSLTRVVATSDGDTMLEDTDTWFNSDDATDPGGTQAVAHVMGGPGAPTGHTLTTLVTDNYSWTFTVSVPAGGQVAVLTFGIQGIDNATVQAEAARVVDLPGDALTGIDAYLNDIVNFAVGGAPLIRMTAPGSIDEGEELAIMVDVTDREGDTATWSWDLDDDGTFGEMPGATMYAIPATDTDGDAAVRIGVEASDGVESRSVYRTITINNLPPEITSTPPMDLVYVGSAWSYNVVVTDPAGSNDFPGFVLLEAPEGMTVSRGGTISWTPDQTQRDMDFHVHLQVDDGDGAMVDQEFDLHVENNRPPGEPVPFSPVMRERTSNRMPTLVTTNAEDPDGDRLSYYFRIDRTSGFNSMFLIESPEIVGMMSGTTGWTVPTFLEPNIYYWQVWANDGIADGPVANAIFVVGDTTEPDAGPPDAGPRSDAGTIAPPPMTRDEGGCSVAPGAGDSPAWAFLGLVLLGLARRRRR